MNPLPGDLEARRVKVASEEPSFLSFEGGRNGVGAAAEERINDEGCWSGEVGDEVPGFAEGLLPVQWMGSLVSSLRENDIRRRLVNVKRVALAEQQHGSECSTELTSKTLCPIRDAVREAIIVTAGPISRRQKPLVF